MKIKNIYTFLLACFFLAVSSGTSSAATYQITDQELTQLEENLILQESLLIQALSLQEPQKEESRELRLQLETALIELVEWRKEMQRLKINLQKASASIEKANLLFQEYEQEAKRTQRRLTRQRNFLTVLLGVGIGAFVVDR